MKTLIILSASVLLLALSACASPKPSLLNYTCGNGENVSTQILNDDRIAVQYRGVIHPMKRQMAASGMRYVGDAFQWWNVKDEGKLQPINSDERYARTEGLTCKEVMQTQ